LRGDHLAATGATPAPHLPTTLRRYNRVTPTGRQTKGAAMAAEMPVRVEPAPGAAVVDFPWSAATTAVAALNRAACTLHSQLGRRADLGPTIDDWVGAYRVEFDAADRRRTTTANDVREALVSLASSIVGGAESANQQQRTNNSQADDPAATAPPAREPVGGRRPI
jgi:hypothetical protein